MNHSLNLTHDGTLIVRVPKGYKVEKVKVETFEGEEIPTHTTPSNTLNSLDCIDRQKAIRNICNQDCHQPQPCKWKCIAIDELETLPSVQPRKGRWIDTTSKDHYKCSLCGTRAAYWFNEENSWEWNEDMSEWLSDFCPNCGADMRGDSHEGSD